MAYLHDIDLNTPVSDSGGFLVFPSTSLDKRLTSVYGPPAHLGWVQDIQLTKVHKFLNNFLEMISF